ncbi:MAG: 1-acyl-sn-glycerol-3-phosphate acyltransferase [Clostridiaceae bacterium]|nr:1-acyl-sn-glycerol-3-phosphate acyltransferase [Clostridiaceae bacterium]
MSGGNKTQEIDYNSVGKTPKAMRTDNKAQKDVVKAPNALIYGAAYIVCWLISKILFRASYRRTRNFRRHKEAMIIIGNHGSYLDAPLAIVGAGWKRMHFVGGDFIYNKKTQKFLDYLRVIPKKQFQPDVRTVLLLIRALQRGRKIMIFPEGQRSVNGDPNYLDPQFSRLVKRAGVAVGAVIFRGAYLAWPRWSTSFVRPGKVVVSSDVILTAEEVKQMTAEEIHLKVKDALNVSDYDFQLSRKKPGKYLTRRPADGLENILHHCPACGEMQAIESTGRTLACRHCGWELRLGLDGFFVPDGPVGAPFFDRPSIWHKWQQEQLAALFATKPDTILTFAAHVARREDQQATPAVAGTISLDQTKLWFTPAAGQELPADELSFPRSGQTGLYASYGKNFRQANRSGTWVFSPEIKSVPIIVHDWLMTGNSL